MMTMKFEIAVEIKSAEVLEKAIRTKAGQDLQIREQIGWGDLGKPYPHEIRIPLEQGKAPYPVGKYLVDAGCVYVDRYGKLSLGRLRLIPTELKVGCSL
jgi:hypothetical protein